jgi:hypothetical protein
MIDPISLTIWSIIIEIVKIWVPVGAALYGLFTLVHWIKTKLMAIDTNVILSIDAINNVAKSVNSNNDSITSELKEQTLAIVGESKELRADFRTFYAPMLIGQQSQTLPVRARKNIKKDIDSVAFAKLMKRRVDKT